MKKSIFLILGIFLIGVCVSTATVNGWASETKVKYTVDNPLIINLGHWDAGPDPYLNNKATTSVLFKDYLEKISSGRIKVIEHRGVIGNSVQVLEQTKLGAIEMCVAHEGAANTIFPLVNVLLIPFLYDNEFVVDHVLDGWFGKEFAQEFLKATGLRILAFTGQAGFRHVVNNKRPVRTPEDMKGLKLRTVTSDAQMKIVELMGATPVPITWGEVYTSIQTGVVDGLDNNANGILLISLYEVTKYITMTSHVYGPGMILANEAWFEKLPAEFKNYITEAAQTIRWGSRVIIRMIEALGYEKLRKKGMEIIYLTEEEKSAFRNKVQPPFKKWLEKKVDREWIDKITKAVDDANQERKFH